MKVVVPGGYMLAASTGGMTIEICSGYGPTGMTMPMNGMSHDGGKQDHGKAGQPCIYAGLNAPVTGGADPLLLELFVAFIIATVFRTVVSRTSRRHPRLRPPLRAPPAHR